MDNFPLQIKGLLFAENPIIVTPLLKGHKLPLLYFLKHTSKSNTSMLLCSPAYIVDENNISASNTSLFYFSLLLVLKQKEGGKAIQIL